MQVMRSKLSRYGIAVALVALALLLTWALEPVLGNTPGTLFYAAVLLSAWYGGLRPSLLSVALSTLSIGFFFLPPHFSLALGLNGILQVCLFLLVALLISSLTAAHRRAEQILRASESRYRTMIEQSPQSVQILSPEGRTTQVNRAWEKLWGVTKAQLGDYNILKDEQLVQKGIMPYIKQAYAGQAAKIPPILYNPEETIPDLTSNEDPERWVSAAVYPLKDDEGRISEVVLMHEDITERKRAEEALRRSESKFRRLAEANIIGVITADLNGHVLDANDAYLKMQGYTREELLAGRLRWNELTAPEYHQLDERAIEQLKQSGICAPFEKEYIRRDGTRVSALVGVALLEGSKDTCIAFVLDITERKEAEEAVRFQAHLLDTVEQAVIATDLDGQITYWNRFAEKLYGWSTAEAIGRNIMDVTPAIMSQSKALEVMDTLRRGESWQGEILVQRRQGDTFPAMVSDTPIQDQEGHLIGIVGVSVDITERLRAEAERASLAAQVERERERLSSIVANVPGVVWEAWGEPDDAAQRIDFVSDYVEKMLGYTVEEWLQTPNFWLHIVHPLDQERAAQEALQKFQSRQGGASEFRWMTKDGRAVWVEAQSVIICDDAGQPVGMRGVTMDISERKQIEDERSALLEREQQARLKAEEANRTKDEFLATLSHELRTPLTAMLGWTRILRARKMDEPTTERALEIIERNATTQARLIEDLLDVSRIITGKLRLEVAPVELVPIIEAAVDAVRPAAEAKSIELSVRLDELTGPVNGDAARLQQVVWNLLVNAVKFTPQGGRVEARLRRAGAQALIEIKDTGEGISAEFLPHVFDRFRQADGSTTRAHGGLGLGLAIVRHLVELHGGEVRAESEGEGAGSTFTLSLPCINLPQPEPLQAIDGEEWREDAHLLKGLRVMVVDDDEDTRELMRMLLEQHGVLVTTLDSTGAALAAFESVKPQLLISDIGLPNEDGYDLLRRLRALGPERGGDIPAAALTAYAGEDARRQALDAGFQVHLAKPISSGELVLAIINIMKSLRV